MNHCKSSFHSEETTTQNGTERSEKSLTMPMRLRDGRFYAPVESQHMILRDGKSVDAVQAHVFNEICSIHGNVQFPKPHWDVTDRVHLWNIMKRLDRNTTTLEGSEKEVVSNSLLLMSETTTSSGNAKTLTGGKSNEVTVNKFGHCHLNCVGLHKLVNCKIITCFRGLLKNCITALALIARVSSKYLVLSTWRIVKWLVRLIFRIPVIFLTYLLAVCKISLLALMEILHKLYNAVKFGSKLSISVLAILLKCLATLVMKFAKWTRFLAYPLSIGKYHILKSVRRVKRKSTVRKVTTTTDLTQPVVNEIDLPTSKWNLIKLTLLTLPVFTFFFITWHFVNPGYTLIHPIEMGLTNAHRISLNSNSRIPAWHIIPETTADNPVSEAFSDGSLIFLLVSDTGYLDSHHRVDIFQTLSVMGYHVVAPIFPISRSQLFEAWSYLHERGKSSNIYLWVDQMEVQVIKNYAEGFCDLGLPPSGVIFETKKKDELGKIRSLEIWSSECNSKQVKKKYNFLKCPVTTQMDNEDLYNEVESCIRAIGMNRSFKSTKC